MMILPGLRGYRKSKALADFAFALESFLRAGAPMDESWFAAGSVAGDPKLEKAALSMTETIKLGKAPGDHLVAHGVFPSDFIASTRPVSRPGNSTPTSLIFTASIAVKRQRASPSQVSGTRSFFFLSSPSTPPIRPSNSTATILVEY